MKNDDWLALIGFYSLLIYSLISQIYAVYFWYVFAQSNDFLISIFLGFFVAEFKGILWPFFI